MSCAGSDQTAQHCGLVRARIYIVYLKSRFYCATHTILFLYFSNPQELDLLSQLYGLFQKFIRFDDRFRETLWADIDLEASFREVKRFLILNSFLMLDHYHINCMYRDQTLLSK